MGIERNGAMNKKQQTIITTRTTMRIKDLKEYKTRLHRLVRYMLVAVFVLAIPVSLAFATYLVISSDSILGISFVAFIDTFVVLVILDIILSD